MDAPVAARVPDRRALRRAAPRVYGILSARVRPSRDAVVVDASPAGVLIDAPVRLRPGAVVELQLETVRRWTTISGRVLRCAIVQLRRSAVTYRAAIAFDHRCAEFVEHGTSGSVVPGTET